MDNSKDRIGKILGAVEEAQGLIDETITPDIEALMTPEQLEKLAEVRKMTGVDLQKASKELEKINNKYKR